MLGHSLVFALPSGRTAEVAPRSARLICDRLWELGLAAGAATAAARISDALHSSSLRADVTFSDRETPTVIEAAKSHPPTWARLVDPGTVDAISLDERHKLVATCLELIEALTADNEHEKLRVVVEELERLRDQLRAMTARELLKAAAHRVSTGWTQGADARAADGRAVDVLDPDAVSWSLLGALQAAAFTSQEPDVEEIRFAVAAIAPLIADPSLAHWNDRAERTQTEVHALLAHAEQLTERQSNRPDSLN